ncbi:hypothetical protein Afil01_26550 [Actinorhabdospora filicis]|uniref:DUF2029 domain-containing protein n=1 Tax=Actinorhabdospora filicis TaxID=1785913 RepID=A0A9W6SKV1_9ACTN|nr:glycosyltransferase 87 family protein [Actinorhabdospora filicis]GLZ77848.1 hypothetical protein Afil01_26550 [Actinorhabdospora filicis]
MRLWTVLAGGLAAATAVAAGIAIGGTTSMGPLFAWYLAAWALFTAAAWALRRVPPRHAAVLVLAGGALIGGTGLLAAPRTSDDAYRYVWDGRVQAAGISPYDHVPADPALRGLRDESLFPSAPDCAGMWDAGGFCTRINRPTVPTIYPPVAEAYFLAVHLAAGATGLDGITALQAAGLLAALGTALVVLRARGPGPAALWAWCPAIALEAVNNAHADVLAALLTVAAFAAAARRPRAGGALLGAGIAAKLLPAVTVPALLAGARKPRAVVPPAIALAVAAATYIPYVLWSRGSVLGYLGGYVGEEGYGDASGSDRFALLRLALPAAWERPGVLLGLTLAVLALVTAAIIARGDPARPWDGAAALVGALLLLTTPGYAWYALLLIGLAALAARPVWLVLGLAAAAAYPALPHAATIAYALAAAVLIAAGIRVRHGRASSFVRDRHTLGGS